MLTLALVLRNLGFLLYGGPLMAFTLLIAMASFVTYLRLEDAIRAYRAFGPGLGLSLGASILGMLVAYYLEHGEFRWGWSTPEEQLTLAAWLCFFALWVSNLRLEVWTLDPLRKLDQDGTISDMAAYRQHARGLLSHLFLHSALITIVTILFTIVDQL